MRGRAPHVWQVSPHPHRALGIPALRVQAHLQRERVRATWEKEACFTSCLLIAPVYMLRLRW